MQSIFEREFVYYDEKCQDNCQEVCGQGDLGKDHRFKNYSTVSLI